MVNERFKTLIEDLSFALAPAGNAEFFVNSGRSLLTGTMLHLLAQDSTTSFEDIIGTILNKGKQL